MKEYVNKAMDYGAYYAYVEKQATESTDSHAEYYPINQKRMERLNKSLVVPNEEKEKLAQLKPLYYLVLAEGWCGDCAQIVPVLAKMAEASKNIDLKILVANQYPELLDQYLTNNARSVPVVIGINKENFKEEFKWGPRPSFGIELLKKHKSNENYTKEEFQKDLQMAYNKNKGIFIMNELIAMHHEIK